MTDRLKTRQSQIMEILERLERLEGRLDAQVTGGNGSYGRKDGDGAVVGSMTGSMSQCSMPEVPERTFAPDVSPDRARLILTMIKKWVNGTKLRYFFFKDGPYRGGNDQMDIVREGFEAWKEVGIGITFEETQNRGEAEIRIGFLQGDGAWSYIGRDIIDVARQGERTMNFGWDLKSDPRREDVAVHEIGHTLGFPHEHQNPFAGIVWDEDAVYRTFGGPPNNWDRQTTFFNILRKLPQSEVQGSSWDPDSIMHYGFPAGMITSPAKYRGGLTPEGGLSDHDMEQVRLFYPPLAATSSETELKPFRSEALALKPAGQKNFLIKPPASRSYTIQTFGGSDTVMVLFEDRNGDLRYVDGDDDSGTDLNSKITVRLNQGSQYVLRIRLYSNFAGGETSVMYW